MPACVRACVCARACVCLLLSCRDLLEERTHAEKVGQCGKECACVSVSERVCES